MTALFKQGDEVRRKSRLVFKRRIPTTLVDPWTLCRLRNVEPVIDHVRQKLYHCGDDVTAAGRAGHDPRPSILENNERRDGGADTLSRYGQGSLPVIALALFPRQVAQ